MIAERYLFVQKGNLATLLFTSVLWALFLLPITIRAQNARLDALANNFCIDDASAVASNPAASVIYYDILQATAFENGLFGPFIAVKALGNHLSIGLTANVNDHGDSVYYYSSVNYLDSTIDTSTNLNAMFPAYPQLVLGANLTFVNLGLKAFYKRSTLETSTIATSGTSNEHIKKDIMIFGISGSAGAQFGFVGIFSFFTYSIPKTQGLYSATDSPTYDATTGNNLIAEAGTEIGIDIKGLNLRLGGVYSLTKYTFTCENSKKGGNPEANKARLTGYLGLNVHPTDAVLLSTAYSLISDNDMTNYSFDAYSLTKTETGVLHYLTASCEYELKLKKIAAQLFIRSGVYWTLSNTTYLEHTESKVTQGWTSDYKEIYSSDASSFIPTLGLGFAKGIIQFDIASKLAGWSGVVSGMPLLTGTLTFDFTKKPAKSTLEKPAIPSGYFK